MHDTQSVFWTGSGEAIVWFEIWKTWKILTVVWILREQHAFLELHVTTSVSLVFPGFPSLLRPTWRWLGFLRFQFDNFRIFHFGDTAASTASLWVRIPDFRGNPLIQTNPCHCPKLWGIFGSYKLSIFWQRWQRKKSIFSREIEGTWFHIQSSVIEIVNVSSCDPFVRKFWKQRWRFSSILPSFLFQQFSIRVRVLDKLTLRSVVSPRNWHGAYSCITLVVSLECSVLVLRERKSRLAKIPLCLQRLKVQNDTPVTRQSGERFCLWPQQEDFQGLIFNTSRRWDVFNHSLRIQCFSSILFLINLPRYLQTTEHKTIHIDCLWSFVRRKWNVTPQCSTCNQSEFEERDSSSMSCGNCRKKLSILSFFRWRTERTEIRLKLWTERVKHGHNLAATNAAPFLSSAINLIFESEMWRPRERIPQMLKVECHNRHSTLWVGLFHCLPHGIYHFIASQVPPLLSGNHEFITMMDRSTLVNNEEQEH